MMNFLVKNSIQVIRVIKGFLLFHLFPRKTIVIISGSMRSGTTLLKALLAEAPDVSNLPEHTYCKYAKQNRYSAYHTIYNLSLKNIVVLKEPIWLTDYRNVPFNASFYKLKIIIMTRNIYDVLMSMRNLVLRRDLEHVRKVYPQPLEYGQLLDYWCKSYEMILHDKKLNDHDVLYVKYEDLVASPIEVTKKAFSFIGSVRKEGTNTYVKPTDYDWKWGSDDGGDKIKKLKVILPELPGSYPSELCALVGNSRKAQAITDKLNYTL